MTTMLTPRLQVKPAPLTKEQQARLAQAHRLNELRQRKKLNSTKKAQIDPTHVQEIIWRYTQKKQNLQKIATRFGCHPRVIRRILKEKGIRIRRPGETSRIPFTPRQEKNITRFYTKDKLSTIKIAAKYGCSPNPIYGVLSRHNVPLRGRENTVTVADNKRILKLRSKLRTARKIAKATGLSPSTVRRWLAYDVLQPLPPRKKVSEKRRKIICHDYIHNKTSTLQLAKHFRCSPYHINHILREQGIAIREGEFKPKLTKRQKTQICKLYLDGMTCIQIGAKLGCDFSYVCQILESYGIPRRPKYRLDPKPVLTEKQQKELCKLYREGMSCARIAPKFNICASSVRNYLVRHNVPRRTRSHYN